MRKSFLFLLVLILAAVHSASAEVNLTSPQPGTFVSSQVHFVASAGSNYGLATSSIIINVDGADRYLTYANWVDTYIPLDPGWRQIQIKSWDSQGHIVVAGPYGVYVTGDGGSSAPAPAPVQSPPATQQSSGGTTAWNLEQQGGWESCSVCAGAGGNGPSADHGMTQWVNSPSRDGNAAQFWMGGWTPYSDVLWWKQVVDGWSNYDANHKAHHFVYDLYFYVDNTNAVQGLEWDVNQFVDGRSYIFGSQCSYRSEGTWDIWDNPNHRWISTGVPCPPPAAYTWHHVILEFERTWDNKLHYISFNMDGNKHYLDWYNDSTWTDWRGITVNFQMDGNYQQENFSTWVNNANLIYW